MNLPDRQRLLALIAGAAVLLLVLDHLVFTPLVKTWEERSVEIAALQKSITNGHSLIDRAARTQSLWHEMETNALPKDPAQAEQEVISSIDKWGRLSGTDLGSIKPQWKRGATERYSLLECHVDATGNVSALTRFLYEIEKSPLALRIDTLDLTSHDDVGQKLTLSLVVSGLRLQPL
jgi:hypothetical protein